MVLLIFAAWSQLSATQRPSSPCCSLHWSSKFHPPRTLVRHWHHSWTWRKFQVFRNKHENMLLAFRFVLYQFIWTWNHQPSKSDRWLSLVLPGGLIFLDLLRCPAMRMIYVMSTCLVLYFGMLNCGMFICGNLGVVNIACRHVPKMPSSFSPLVFSTGSMYVIVGSQGHLVVYLHSPRSWIWVNIGYWTENCVVGKRM